MEYENMMFVLIQVMETENIIYLVTEYASRGEVFGKHVFTFLVNIFWGRLICKYFIVVFQITLF